jgi:glucans biosynthesis protein C
LGVIGARNANGAIIPELRASYLLGTVGAQERTTLDERRHDLDWLRIIAFALLILYHVGMFYVTWDWHVKSSRASDVIEPLMRLTNPWRLSLLFLIAGVATRFMADKMSAVTFARSRMLQLWPPFLLAIFVIVPPQSYYEVVEALRKMPGPIGPPQSLWLDQFYVKYVTASGNWCDEDGCLITPTYNHMWFVAYLIIYTLVVLPLIPIMRKVPQTISVLLSGPGLILAPWAIMFLLRIFLLPIFGETREFWNDWYLHALFFATFVFGFAVAKFPSFFERCAIWRWAALAITIGAWVMVITFIDLSSAGAARLPGWSRLVVHGVRELQAWTAIIAMIGFSHHHLRYTDGPVKRVLTIAIFPFYVVHQTIIVVAAHHLDGLRWPIAIEALLLIGITAAGCWIFFDIGRRMPALRVWMGLPPGAVTPTKPL